VRSGVCEVFSLGFFWRLLDCADDLEIEDAMPLGGGLCIAHLAIADWWHLKSFGFLRFLASRLQIQHLPMRKFLWLQCTPKMFAPTHPKQHPA